MGDFGLATRRSDKQELHTGDEGVDGASLAYDAIEDTRGLLENSVPYSVSGRSHVSQSSAGESLTGGVGTTFYRAPEQEGRPSTAKGDSSYSMKADLFSLGIVLFEMFHPPFDTVGSKSLVRD